MHLAQGEKILPLHTIELRLVSEILCSKQMCETSNSLDKKKYIRSASTVAGLSWRSTFYILSAIDRSHPSETELFRPIWKPRFLKNLKSLKI